MSSAASTQARFFITAPACKMLAFSQPDAVASSEVELPCPTLTTFGEPELTELDERTAHVLRMRSGMVDGERHTLRGVAEELGVQKERVRQIQNQGLALIRQIREVQRHLRREPKIEPPYRGGRPPRRRKT